MTRLQIRGGVSDEGLKIAMADSEKQRVDAALAAVNYNIEQIMLKQIAPLLARRDELETRSSALKATIYTLTDIVRNR